MVTAEKLLNRLPPYRDEWVLVKKDQVVGDIIQQVLKSHQQYAGYYDKIALLFDADTIKQICENLYQFCEKEIRYREESDDDQTTALPTGILTRGEGDCKHYANFCGGVLDGINRLTGRKIKWWYRFISEKILVKVPHHVFIVVLDDDGKEIWIDPVPGSSMMSPVWQLDKKIKAETMSLYNNIGSIDRMRSGYYGDNAIGLVDPETLESAFQTAGELQEGLTNFIKNLTDKVPDYPVKSKNTFNSLVASINEIMPLPPSSMADAKRLLDICYAERAKAVGRGTDRATLTVIMLIDERIVALKNYIQNGGSLFALPTPGSGSTELIKSAPTLTAGFGSGMSSLLLVGAGVGLYLATRKKPRSVHGKGSLLTTALVVGGVILLIRNARTPMEHEPVGSQGIMYDPGQAQGDIYF